MEVSISVIMRILARWSYWEKRETTRTLVMREKKMTLSCKLFFYLVSVSADTQPHQKKRFNTVIGPNRSSSTIRLGRLQHLPFRPDSTQDGNGKATYYLRGNFAARSYT